MNGTSRIVGLPQHTGPLRSDGAYVKNVALAVCPVNGAMFIVRAITIYDGAEPRAYPKPPTPQSVQVVLREGSDSRGLPIWRRFVAAIRGAAR